MIDIARYKRKGEPMDWRRLGADLLAVRGDDVREFVRRHHAVLELLREGDRATWHRVMSGMGGQADGV